VRECEGVFTRGCGFVEGTLWVVLLAPRNGPPSEDGKDAGRERRNPLGVGFWIALNTRVRVALRPLPFAIRRNPVGIHRSRRGFAGVRKSAFIFMASAGNMPAEIRFASVCEAVVLTLRNGPTSDDGKDAGRERRNPLGVGFWIDVNTRVRVALRP